MSLIFPSTMFFTVVCEIRDAAVALMKPANEDVLVSWPVSKAVGNVKNNSAELLA